ncbi:MAG TPA: PDZ domain-containing protein, partial [Planctomycetota bacterium]|nr:PDZ domain-containing protein [Planctomycetota bacterium]
INNAIVRLNQNISFAIPASQVQATLNERLLNVDRTRRFWLGMRIEPRDGALRVKAVDRGGPAAKSDIQPGDVIVEVDGKPVADERAYAKAILPLAAGQTVPMRVRRGKKDRELRLELLSYDDRVIWERLGVAVRESRVNGEPTVQVQSVDPDGPAAEVKIRPNDYLWSVIVKRRDPWGGVLPDDWQLLSKGRFREIVETFATSRQKVLPVRVVRGEQWLWGEIALR